MKQTPRYDPPAVDPLSLKPQLSELFNKTWEELRDNCHLKQKIFIGSHNLECSGATRAARYIDVNTGKYDGVQLFGRLGVKAYTNSILNLLKCTPVIDDKTDLTNISTQYRFRGLGNF